MPGKSDIEWTGDTWNPVTGCTKVGPGCDHCYAETQALRWAKDPNSPYHGVGFNLKLHPGRLDWPLRKRRPRVIFVNSMSDLFHKDIPESYLDRIWDVMEAADWHVFQVLTKRSSLMARYLKARYAAKPPHAQVLPNHIWPGVSVEDRPRTNRIGHLLRVPSMRRFISFEPLLGPVGDVDLSGVAWAIVGGESGMFHRPMDANWARQIREQCRKHGTAFFFKQWGGRTAKAGGRELDGQTWDEYPVPRSTLPLPPVAAPDRPVAQGRLL